MADEERTARFLNALGDATGWRGSGDDRLSVHEDTASISPLVTRRFSIITAAFNRADLLPRCLDSVLRQSFGAFEVIVVDDGSMDNTADVVADYTNRDRRVRYLRQEQQGANAARNNGSRTAEGEYILFFDSDDEAYPQWLEALDRLISASGAAVACCGIEFCDSQGRNLGARQPAEELLGSTRGGLFHSGTYAVRRDVFTELNGFAVDLPAHQSTEFRMRLYDLCDRRGYRITSITDRLIRAHSHDGPKIRRDAQAKLVATQYILAEHRDKFESQRSIASWLASAGGCAAELARYSEARRYFAEAIRTWPANWKNYVRLAIACTPILRRRFWQDTGKSAYL